MPIEIRELVIKATLGGEAPSKAADSVEKKAMVDPLDEERLVKKVVEKVMDLIKMRRER
ncbi:MAG: DUF5908 family protein [Bacteroidota bacterium]